MSGEINTDRAALEGDAAIGANVGILRGPRTQKWVADEMQKLGIKWTQTTVWEIESGKRSLKAKEAKALASVLGTHVQNLFGETVVTQTRQVILRRIRKLQTLEIAAAEAIEQYALARTKCLELAEEVMYELEYSGVDHDAVLWAMAKDLKRLSMKSLEDVLGERASAIQKAKETFGEGSTLRFHPGGVNEHMAEDEAPYDLGAMLTEEEASGEHSEEA